MHYTTTIAGNHCKIRMHGAFTFDDHPTFRAMLNELEEVGIEKCDIDFSGVEFVDSAALGMLLLMRERAEKNAYSITLHSPRGQVKKMLEISEFGTLFHIEDMS